MNKKIYQALNEQIGHEFYSSHLYLSIASYFDNIPLEGFTKWFRKQAEEEREHGIKIFDYINDRNLQVEIPLIDKPPVKFNSVPAILEIALAHEKKVTHWIYQIYELAIKEKDHATAVFLQWYITEQVEEEKNAQDHLDLITLIGDDKSALLVMDQNLSKQLS